MANELIPFEQVPLPAYITDQFPATETNLTSAGTTVPSLSFTGKVWTISVEGNKQQLMRVDQEGEESPLSTFRVVILDFNKARGRAYYKGAYNREKTAPPDCWSHDRKTPDAAVENPPSRSCATCPMAVKGSRVTDNNKPAVACSEYRMVVVVPATKLDFTPLRMKIAVTSDWDGQSKDLQAQGWFAFSNYIDFLKNRVRAPHSSTIVTKMKFDPSVAYTKILFAPDRWLTPEEIATIKPVIDTPAVTDLLSREWTPAGADGVRTETPPAAPEVQAGAAIQVQPPVTQPIASAPVVQPAPAPPPIPQPPQPQAAPAPVTTVAAPAIKVPSDDDDDGSFVIRGLNSPAATASPQPAALAAAPAPPAPKPAAPKAEPIEVPDELKSILTDWAK